MARIRRRVKKKIIIFLVIFLVLVGIGTGVGIYLYKQHKEELRIAYEKEMYNKVKSHYSDIVEITKETTLYEKVDDNYLEVGSIGASEVVSLEEEKITFETKYFKIKELGYYVKYQGVKKAEKLIEKSDRYKNYLLFNENVVTKENSKLLRDGKVVYTLKKSLDKPIIMKDDKGYYIEEFGELLFVSKEDVEKTYKVNNTNAVEASGVPVTVYHFIYLEGDKSCNEGICHSEKQIKEHFNYLRNNKFFTMNTTELRLYLEGKLRVPKKSILITIDDGARAHNFVPLLEEYKINATLFLISSWYPKSKFKSDYMEIASHTHNLHTPGVCSGGQGSPLKCLDKTKLVADLKKSRETLDGTEAFCYPFYEYNDYAISALKEAGFKMAFMGGYRKAKRGDNLFLVPRIPLNRNTTLQQYTAYIN